MADNIKLGTKVTDSLTGFSGVATGKASYITGCDQYLVQPRGDDSKTKVEPHWFDVNRLDVDLVEPVVVLDTEEDKGPCGLAQAK